MGTCVIDLHGFLQQDPWQALADTFQVPLPAGRRPWTATAAREAARCLAGVPRSSLQRIARQIQVSSMLDACIRSAKEMDMTTVLALDAPHDLAAALTQRAGGDATAALVSDIRHGRLAGPRGDWEGPCGLAVCLAVVAREAGHRYGRPVCTVSDAVNCPCARDVVAPGRFLLQRLSM